MTPGDQLITADDVGVRFRVTVEPGWRGMNMQRTFVAQLEVKAESGRYRKVGRCVMCDTGPTDAVKATMMLLDDGGLRA